MIKYLDSEFNTGFRKQTTKYFLSSISWIIIAIAYIFWRISRSVSIELFNP